MNTNIIHTILVTALMLLLTILSSDANAQRFGPQQMATTYSGKSGAISFTVPGWVMRLGLKSTDKEMPDAFKGVRQLRLLVIDKSDVDVNERHVSRLQKTLTNRKHEPLVTVRSEGDDVRIYLRERRGKVKALTILVNTPEELVMVHLNGSISMSKIDQLINNYSSGNGKGKRTISFK
jgi:hypothetical protein